MYKVIKTYGHDLGLSCCFRQHKAQSHCAKLHGYAIAVRLEFGSDTLNDKNWVIDFGALKPVKDFLQKTFDHKTIVAEDDPLLSILQAAEGGGVLDLVVLPSVGCEMFARYIFDTVSDMLADVWYGMNPEGHVKLLSVQVNEHGANAASYSRGIS